MIVEHRLNRLARLANADREKRFDRLFRELTKPDFLSYAYEQIKNNKGSKTPGIDGLTNFDCAEQQTNLLAVQLQSGKYESAQSKLNDIKEVCRKLSTPEVEVIRKLNNMLIGWMTYYRCVSAPSRVMSSVLAHTWSIYGKYVSRKNGCRLAQAAQRWIKRCSSSPTNPKGGQKTWMAETVNKAGKTVREYLLCVPVQKRSIYYVARKIRLGTSWSKEVNYASCNSY